jgi:hypothetical protein
MGYRYTKAINSEVHASYDRYVVELGELCVYCGSNRLTGKEKPEHPISCESRCTSHRSGRRALSNSRWFRA